MAQLRVGGPTQELSRLIMKMQTPPTSINAGQRG